MKLKVIKPFIGKAEGKTLCIGDVVESNDVERLNALIGGGFCVIVSLDDVATPGTDVSGEVKDKPYTYTTPNGRDFGLDEVKAALSAIGVSVAANAKENGITKAISKLTDEQVSALNEYLDNSVNQ